jgi:hypothetical protein
MAGWGEGHLQEGGGQSGSGMTMPEGGGPTWSSLLTRTYSLYREQFTKLLLISLPPSFLAYFFQFIHIQRLIVRGMRQHGWLPAPHTPGYWTTLTMVALFDGAVYWVISGFFLAGIASNVLSNSENRPVIADAFSKARERLTAVIAVTVLIWATFALSRDLVFFSLTALLERFGLANYNMQTVIFGLAYLLLGGLFSRAGLAIPALIDDRNASISDALRRSLRQTENWEPFFILFLAKSALLAYVAYWLVNLGLNDLADRGKLTPETYPWVQSLVYICIAAMLESPLFIAFSLLYGDSKNRRENPVTGWAIQ